MARKSRKNTVVAQSEVMNTALYIKTAEYIRLSVEDSHNKGNSIENQKRPMMWDTFMSLMLLFISNNDTKKQLDELEIDTKKISNFLKIKKKRVKK